MTNANRRLGGSEGGGTPRLSELPDGGERSPFIEGFELDEFLDRDSYDQLMNMGNVEGEAGEEGAKFDFDSAFGEGILGLSDGPPTAGSWSAQLRLGSTPRPRGHSGTKNGIMIPSDTNQSSTSPPKQQLVQGNGSTSHNNLGSVPNLSDRSRSDRSGSGGWSGRYNLRRGGSGVSKLRDSSDDGDLPDMPDPKPVPPAKLAANEVAAEPQHAEALPNWGIDARSEEKRNHGSKERSDCEELPEAPSGLYSSDSGSDSRNRLLPMSISESERSGQSGGDDARALAYYERRRSTSDLPTSDLPTRQTTDLIEAQRRQKQQEEQKHNVIQEQDQRKQGQQQHQQQQQIQLQQIKEASTNTKTSAQPILQTNIKPMHDAGDLLLSQLDAGHQQQHKQRHEVSGQMSEVSKQQQQQKQQSQQIQRFNTSSTNFVVHYQAPPQSAQNYAYPPQYQNAVAGYEVYRHPSQLTYYAPQQQQVQQQQRPHYPNSPSRGRTMQRGASPMDVVNQQPSAMAQRKVPVVYRSGRSQGGTVISGSVGDNSIASSSVEDDEYHQTKDTNANRSVSPPNCSSSPHLGSSSGDGFPASKADAHGAILSKRSTGTTPAMRRIERNQREQKRSNQISQKIDGLRKLLNEAGIAVKPAKSAILTATAQYIRSLQAKQTRLEAERDHMLTELRSLEATVPTTGRTSAVTNTGHERHQVHRQTSPVIVKSESLDTPVEVAASGNDGNARSGLEFVQALGQLSDCHAADPATTKRRRSPTQPNDEGGKHFKNTQSEERGASSENQLDNKGAKTSNSSHVNAEKPRPNVQPCLSTSHRRQEQQQQNTAVDPRVYEQAFANSSVPLAVVSLDGTFMRVNAKFIEVCGYSADELSQRTIFNLVAPSQLHVAFSYVSLVLRGVDPASHLVVYAVTRDGKPASYAMAVSLVAHDGAPRYFSTSLAPLTNAPQQGDTGGAATDSRS
eukprot:CAMPEP_0197318280 /NCGR_PEP_ID=MMETSP0891-20130614/50289_1 /TAXON_ID=44058 ORGANISM="Aureoumbra lagunensis, Strain CCMP1510" /NCGR_SAMPLE_ID=MMETSP0891 /ASSEMBLY_ACC=CAM_ASM_000534 /LENGTH=958 /DNA_ID=CAMNT_0042808639 /DNA_START=85 /DNA_END=2961 /DNA_ORIENTATION=-